MLRLLDACGLRTLTDLAILDVGCGDGNMLRRWLQWGAHPEHLAGIDLRADAVERARTLNPNLDVRLGSAEALPWQDESFDLVSQLTVFTSILDVAMKRRVATEMSRVLRSGGAVLWYDFAYNNPPLHRSRAASPSRCYPSAIRWPPPFLSCAPTISDC
jgi:ubiquinone/menaquinone biosynthesis C-methylase UbiE